MARVMKSLILPLTTITQPQQQKHAEAVTIQAVAALYQSQLVALQKAQDVGIGIKELCPFILKTLNNLYSCGINVLISFTVDSESTGEEPKVLVLETPLTVERKRPMRTTMDHSDDIMFCAAGDICVNSLSLVIDSDPVCPMCKKMHMQFVLSLQMMRRRDACHASLMKSFEIEKNECRIKMESCHLSEQMERRVGCCCHMMHQGFTPLSEEQVYW